jgi:hypothetical protein
MMRLNFGLIGLLFLSCLSWSASAAWQIVTHRDSELTPLQLVDVKLLFMEGLVQGKSPQLVELSDEVLRAQFYESVLGISQNRWRAHWAKRVFTGSRQLPKQFALDYITHYLDTNPNAVAYLPNEIPIPETLKVIYCSPHQGVTMEGSGCAPTLSVHTRLVEKSLINGVD